MRRREFITLLGSAAAWPIIASAQQGERIRRIGILIPGNANESESQARIGAFMQGLQQLGWTIGRNVRIDARWATGNLAEVRRHAAELVALAPDVILAHGAATVTVLHQVTRAVPIVFPLAIDPVGAGIVESLSRPRGNATGFEGFQYSLGGKWLELLKQIAPDVTRVAILRDPEVASGIGQLEALQTVAPSFGVVLTAVDVRGAEEIQRAVAEFAGEPNGGLIATATPLVATHRELIMKSCSRAPTTCSLFRKNLCCCRRSGRLWA